MTAIVASGTQTIVAVLDLYEAACNQTSTAFYVDMANAIEAVIEAAADRGLIITGVCMPNSTSWACDLNRQTNYQRAGHATVHVMARADA